MPLPPLTYEEELRHNLTLSRTILHHTSRHRLLTSRSYTIALKATLSLTRSIPYFRRAASLTKHLAAIAMLDTSLRLARSRAAKKTLSVPLSQDVYAMLCHFLGISEAEKKDSELLLVDHEDIPKRRLLLLRRDRTRFGPATSFVDLRGFDPGDSPAGKPSEPKKERGRASLGVELDKGMMAKEASWRKTKSVPSIGNYFSFLQKG